MSRAAYFGAIGKSDIEGDRLRPLCTTPPNSPLARRAGLDLLEGSGHIHRHKAIHGLIHPLQGQFGIGMGGLKA